MQLGEWRESSKMCASAYGRGGGGGQKGITPHVYVLNYTISFCLMVSRFIYRNLSLPSFKKGVIVRNGSISVVKK